MGGRGEDLNVILILRRSARRLFRERWTIHWVIKCFGRGGGGVTDNYRRPCNHKTPCVKRIITTQMVRPKVGYFTPRNKNCPKQRKISITRKPVLLKLGVRTFNSYWLSLVPLIKRLIWEPLLKASEERIVIDPGGSNLPEVWCQVKL